MTSMPIPIHNPKSSKRDQNWIDYLTSQRDQALTEYQNAIQTFNHEYPLMPGQPWQTLAQRSQDRTKQVGPYLSKLDKARETLQNARIKYEKKWGRWPAQ